MKRYDFDYAIYAMVRISGRELQLIVAASENHYDGVCKSASRCGGFIYGMVMRWIMSQDESECDIEQFKSMVDGLEREEEHRLSNDQLQTLAKCCEFYDDSDVRSLHSQFCQILRECSEEFKRCDGEK